MATTPRPGRSWRSFGGVLDDSARQSLGHHRARDRMQRAEAARRRHGEQRLLGFARPRAGSAVTAGAPTVTVPVLSRISVSTSEARSKKSALLMRMRRRVATVIAATTAAGPATTRAVGVATTSTAMARERFSVKNSVVAARVSTSGSHTPARRSKSRSTGTEVRSTSARSWTTRPSTVSAPAPRT